PPETGWFGANQRAGRAGKLKGKRRVWAPQDRTGTRGPAGGKPPRGRAGGPVARGAAHAARHPSRAGPGRRAGPARLAAAPARVTEGGRHGMSRAVSCPAGHGPGRRPKEGSLMKRLWTFAAMLALTCAAAPLHAETRTWFGFQIGVNGGGPPPAFAFRSEPH